MPSTGRATGRDRPTPVDEAAGEPDEPIEFEFLPGPQADWFSAELASVLAAGSWQVTPSSNRVGLRLRGPALPRLRDEELPSQGLVSGAVQVPRSGELVIFLADHPVTGGYPVVAVLSSLAVQRAAQARPGNTVRFRPAAQPG